SAKQALARARDEHGPGGEGGVPPEVEAAAAALAEAHAELDAATAPIAGAVEAAWERNRQAVQAAKAAADEAIGKLAEVETCCGTAARDRDPLAPAMTDEERARCVGARQQVIAALEAVDEAVGVFKAGVTADQLELEGV